MLTSQQAQAHLSQHSSQESNEEYLLKQMRDNASHFKIQLHSALLLNNQYKVSQCMKDMYGLTAVAALSRQEMIYLLTLVAPHFSTTEKQQIFEEIKIRLKQAGNPEETLHICQTMVTLSEHWNTTQYRELFQLLIQLKHVLPFSILGSLAKYWLPQEFEILIPLIKKNIPELFTAIKALGDVAQFYPHNLPENFQLFIKPSDRDKHYDFTGKKEEDNTSYAAVKKIVACFHQSDLENLLADIKKSLENPPPALSDSRERIRYRRMIERKIGSLTERTQWDKTHLNQVFDLCMKVLAGHIPHRSCGFVTADQWSYELIFETLGALHAHWNTEQYSALSSFITTALKQKDTQLTGIEFLIAMGTQAKWTKEQATEFLKFLKSRTDEMVVSAICVLKKHADEKCLNDIFAHFSEELLSAEHPLILGKVTTILSSLADRWNETQLGDIIYRISIRLACEKKPRALLQAIVPLIEQCQNKEILKNALTPFIRLMPLSSDHEYIAVLQHILPFCNADQKQKFLTKICAERNPISMALISSFALEIDNQNLSTFGNFSSANSDFKDLIKFVRDTYQSVDAKVSAQNKSDSSAGPSQLKNSTHA